MMFSSRRVAVSMLAVSLIGIQCLSLSVGAFSPTAVKPSSTRTLSTNTRVLIQSVVSTTVRQEATPFAWTTKRSSSKPAPRQSSSFALASSSTDENDEDPLFDPRTTISLVGGQSLLILAAIIAATLLKTPNFGFGPSIDFSLPALQKGTLCAIPLFVFAYALDAIEDNVPALQDVTKATQRSVLALLGGTLKPILAIIVSLALGLVAGLGEELLFRGVLQYEVSMKFGNVVGISVSSIIFGLLHAVTPLYAILATMASVFFGFLYTWSGNLAVPIITHAVYDVGALLWAHWTVTKMTPDERQDLVDWKGPTEREKE